MGTIFLYDVEFVAYANPPRRAGQFAEALGEFVQASGLDYLMSALGGTARARGIVFRRAGDVSQRDREAVAAFARQQPIAATARIGELEPETEATNYFRPVTEWVFAVDNLTDADRAEAAAYHEEMRRRVQAVKKKS